MKKFFLGAILCSIGLVVAIFGPALMIDSPNGILHTLGIIVIAVEVSAAVVTLGLIVSVCKR